MEEVEASAGGGMVTVKISGDLVVKAVVIDPEAIDPEDAELLQDMVTGGDERGDPLGAAARRRPHGRHRRRPRRRRPRRSRHPGDVGDLTPRPSSA